jgi:putative ABC transport system permease protein
MEVIGQLKETAPPDAMLFRRDYLEEALLNPGRVNTFWIAAADSQSVPLILQESKKTFANSGNEVDCEEESVFVTNMAAGVKSVIIVLQSIGFIVVVIVGLVAGNTAAMAVRERAGELAVMQALGFETRIIFSTVVAENLAIALAGGILGAAASPGMLRSLPMLSASLGPLAYIHIPLSVLTKCLLMSTLIGVSSGVLPAAIQLRKDVVQSLRQIG